MNTTARKPRIALRLMLLLSGLVVIALGWLLGTESGLRWSLRFAAQQASAELKLSDAGGRWLDRVELTGVAVTGPFGDYAVERFVLDWSPPALLRGELRIEALHVRGVRARPAAAQQPPPVDTQPFEPGWDLLLSIALQDVLIEDVEWLSPATPDRPLRLDTARLVADAGGDQVRLETLSVRAPLFDVDAGGDLSLARAGRSSLRADWRARPPDRAAFGGRLTVEGGWDRLEIGNELERPFVAHTRLTLEALLAEINWRLSTRFDPVALDDIDRTLPPHRLGLDLQAAGTATGATLETQIRSDALDGELKTFDLNAVLQRVQDAAGGGWHIETAALRRHDEPGEITLAGQWRDSGAIDADLNWQSLHWPLQGEPRFQSDKGTAALHGTLDAFHLDAGFDAYGVQLPQSRWHIEARGDTRHLDLDTLNIALLDGALKGSGRVAWAPQPVWSLTLTADRLDPGRHWPDYPGRVSARLQTDGELTPEQPPRVNAVLDSVAGQLRGLRLSGNAHVRMDRGVTHIDAIDLNIGDAHTRVRGQIGDRLDLQWTVKADRLDRLSPKLTGRVNSQGTLTGTRAAPHLQGDAEVAGLKLGDMLSVGMLKTSVDAGLERERSQIDLHATTVKFGPRELNDVRGFLHGNPARHQLRLRGLGPGLEAGIDAEGAWTRATGDWHGRMTALNLNANETGAWELARPIDIAIAKDQLTTSDSCLKGGLAKRPALVCADFQRDPRGWRLNARTARLSLQQLGPWLPVGASANGRLSGALRVGGLADRPDAPSDLSLDLFLSPGALRFEESGQPRELEIKGGRIQSVLDDRGTLAGNLQLNLLDDDHLKGHWRLPAFQWRDWTQQAVEFDLDGELKNLAVIDAWVADIEKLDGEVDLALRARGTLGRPQVNGAAGFTGGLEIPKAGTRLTDVKLAVEGTLAEQLRLTGHARSGDGDIDVDGELDLRDTEALSGQIKITGDQFLAVDLRDTRVLISPQLYAQLNKRDILIGGLLLVPEAHLRLSSSQSNRVNESSDVILVNGDETEQAARRKFYRVTTDLALVLGDAVQFEGYGLETGVTGAVRVSQTPGALMTGIGEINLKDGTYEAYGQKLTLESGRIFYAGGPLSRPGIDLRAVRKTGDVLAGVKVLGTVQNPTTELYSDPAMTQSETLSYLLLGRPLNRASSEEGQMLANAAVSLGLKGGNLIAEQITGTFGLDQLSFESGETYRDASMVVGKYLTPRLYIDYSVGLIDAVNRLRMHYQLSEHWSVQTEAGEEAGGDLLFSIER